MQKILEFELSGKFAHFNYPFTSPNHLKKSYNLPPRTTLLGMLGSIIGLKGFQQYGKEKFPEYYEKLNHIPISISVDKIHFKKIVKYNSLNSFAKNISKDPNVIIKEEIILNPKYKILLFLDDSINVDKELLKRAHGERIESNYHIYLGKNEFFANISNIKIIENEDFKFVDVKNVKNMSSIIPFKLFDKEDVDDIGNSVIDSFSYDIDFSNKKMKTKNVRIVHFLKSELQRGNVVFNKSTELVLIRGEHYFFFKNENNI